MNQSFPISGENDPELGSCENEDQKVDGGRQVDDEADARLRQPNPEGRISQALDGDVIFAVLVAEENETLLADEEQEEEKVDSHDQDRSPGLVQLQLIRRGADRRHPVSFPDASDLQKNFDVQDPHDGEGQDSGEDQPGNVLVPEVVVLQVLLVILTGVRAGVVLIVFEKERRIVGEGG